MCTQARRKKTEIQGVLEILNFIKDNTASKNDIARLDKRIDVLDEKVDIMDVKIGSLDKKVDSLAVRMVTKEYLDDKLADLRGDLVVLMRKEDVKVRALVGVMMQKQLLSKEEANKILSMETFPQLAL